MLHKSFRNRAAIQTHPLDRETPCVISRELEVPAEAKSALKMRVSHHPHGDWQLRVLVGDEVLAQQIVGPDAVDKEWLDLSVDLTRFAGQKIQLSIENRANNWSNEWAYWSEINVVSE